MRVALAVFLLLLSSACQPSEAELAAGRTFPVSIEAEGATLAGDIFMPDRVPRGGVPGVAVVHGSGTNPRAMLRYIVRPLNAMGIAVLAYDKRGVGDSSGVYQDVGTANSIEALGQLADDASRAAKLLASHAGVDAKRVGLVGASQAGWIMPIAATRDSGISFLIVISGPAVSVGYEILHGRLTNELNPAAVTLDKGEIDRRLKAFAGPYGYDPMPTLAALETPTLWMMGDRDINLPVKETIDALSALPQISSGVLTLLRYPDADHGLRGPDGSPAPYWDDVRAWLLKRGIINP